MDPHAIVIVRIPFSPPLRARSAGVNLTEPISGPLFSYFSSRSASVSNDLGLRLDEARNTRVGLELLNLWSAKHFVEALWEQVECCLREGNRWEHALLCYRSTSKISNMSYFLVLWWSILWKILLNWRIFWPSCLQSCNIIIIIFSLHQYLMFWCLLSLLTFPSSTVERHLLCGICTEHRWHSAKAVSGSVAADSNSSLCEARFSLGGVSWRAGKPARN